MLGTGTYGGELGILWIRQGRSERGRLRIAEIRPILPNRSAKEAPVGRSDAFGREGIEEISGARADCLSLVAENTKLRRGEGRNKKRK